MSSKVKVGDFVQWMNGGIANFVEPKRVESLSPDGQYAYVTGSGMAIPVGELEVDDQFLDDAGIQAWAKTHGAKFSIDIGYSKLRKYKGVVLTQHNSDAMERRYLDDLEEEGRRWCKHYANSYEDWEREVLKRELYVLVKYALGYDKLEFYVHYPICRFIENLLRKTNGRGHLQLPRSTYKTSIGTIGGTVQEILRDPNAMILIKSHEEEMAKRKAEEARDRMHASPDIQRLFPELLSTKKTDLVGGNWKCPARTEVHAEDTITYAGGKQGKTGAHYSVIFADDLWDEMAVRSPKTLATCLRNVRNMKFLRKDSSTRIIYVDTRWSHDDPTNVLLKNPNYEHMIASAITSRGVSLFESTKADGGGYTLRDLHGQFLEGEYEFSCQMMNNPSSEGQGFQENWFRYLSYDGIVKASAEDKLAYRNCILFDLAASGEGKSDFNAAIVITVDSNERILITGVWQRRCTPFEFQELLFNLADRFNVEFLMHQKQNTETHQKPEFDRINRERAKVGKKTYGFLEYRLRGGDTNKTIRMGTVTIPMQQGRMFFNSDDGDHTADMPKLISQMQKYPYLAYDDLLDCLSQQNDKRVTRAPSHSANVAMPKVTPATREDVHNMERDWRRERAQEAFDWAENSEKEFDLDTVFDMLG